MVQVKRPDVVEVWDVTSHDPRLLVFLKAYRNAVPVPRHWSSHTPHPTPYNLHPTTYTLNPEPSPHPGTHLILTFFIRS